ncbi:tetratricopeptide repeat protein [Shewanella marina]|uniref:tetratricopeptide repeat protein n=1 Tax=Shewanella marina TaxID=487319 RepID=UPI00046F4C1F|nr:tetratricopeptide repeat protein [Shewanella marina]
MNNILDLTKENIQQVVDASMQQVVVVMFWANQSPEAMSTLANIEQIAQAQSGRFVLAKVDCETQMEIAQYFRIQQLPTILVLKQGQPVDGLAGPQTTEQLATMLEQHLPPLWQLQLAQAKQLLANDDATAASELLKQALIASDDAQIKLVLADAQLSLNDIAQAEMLLSQIGLADQDGYYQNLKAKLALALEAADTPEIRELQQQYDAAPDNLDVMIALAKALHQARRDDEALALLFAPLTKDISAHNGQVKAAFLEVVTALGQGSVLANQYRRKLYSLLY